MSTSTPSRVSTAVGVAGAPRRRRKDERPAELMAAALELFVEKGYAATRLDDVAAHAGVSKGTLYLYFDSKDALFKAVVEQGIVPLLVVAEQQIDGYSGSSGELLRLLIVGWWQRIGATRLAGLIKLIIAEARNFPDLAQYYHDQVIVRGRGLLRAVLQRGMASGEFRQLDVESAIDVIFASLLMLVVWRSSLCNCGREIDPDVFLPTHFDLLMHGLCPQKGHQ
jgi:AcrR family transcriptional regulator